MRLLNFTSGKVTKGEVIFDGKDLQKLSEKEMREIRGGKMSMIFQEPMSSLNPAMRIDKQMIEGTPIFPNRKRVNPSAERALFSLINIRMSLRIQGIHVALQRLLVSQL